MRLYRNQSFLTCSDTCSSKSPPTSTSLKIRLGNAAHQVSLRWGTFYDFMNPNTTLPTQTDYNLLLARSCVCIKAPVWPLRGFCSLYAPYMITPILLYYFTVFSFLHAPQRPAGVCFCRNLSTCEGNTNCSCSSVELCHSASQSKCSQTWPVQSHSFRICQNYHFPWPDPLWWGLKPI